MSEQTFEVRRLHSFSMIADAVLDDNRVGKNELLAYMALCRHADKVGTCFPSYATIADKARLSRKHVIIAVNNLVSLGILQKHERLDPAGDRTSNLYVISDTPSAATVIQTDSGGGVPATPRWCPSDTRGGVVGTPEVYPSEPDLPKGKEEVSSPVSEKAPKTPEKPTSQETTGVDSDPVEQNTGDTPNILTTIVRKLVTDLNAATGWNVNLTSARATLLGLRDEGLLDSEYLQFVAEQPRVQNAAHFIQSLRSRDFVEKFEAEQYKYRSLTDDNHVRCFCGACFVELFDGGACTTHTEAPVLRWPELQTAVVALRGDAAWAEKVAELEAAKRERRLEERRKQSEAESRMTWEELSQVGMSKLTPAGEKRLAELRQAENAELEAKLAGRTWAQYMRDQKAKQASAEVQT